MLFLLDLGAYEGELIYFCMTGSDGGTYLEELVTIEPDRVEPV